MASVSTTWVIDDMVKSDKVSIVRAHTLPERNASCRVLTKCGFKLIGEVNDPEDGPVWRWEKEKEPEANHDHSVTV